MLHLYRDVFASFHAHDVKYVVIDGTPATLHGVARMTFDVDILIEATIENAKRVLDALLEARMGTAALTDPKTLLAHEITVVQDYVRLDVQIKTPGLDFQESWDRRQTMHVAGQPFFVITRDDLIVSKKAAGRPIDLADVRALQVNDKPEAT